MTRPCLAISANCCVRSAVLSIFRTKNTYAWNGCCVNCFRTSRSMLFSCWSKCRESASAWPKSTSLSCSSTLTSGANVYLPSTVSRQKAPSFWQSRIRPSTWLQDSTNSSQSTHGPTKSSRALSQCRNICDLIVEQCWKFCSDYCYFVTKNVQEFNQFDQRSGYDEFQQIYIGIFNNQVVQNQQKLRCKLCEAGLYYTQLLLTYKREYIILFAEQKMIIDQIVLNINSLIIIIDDIQMQILMGIKYQDCHVLLGWFYYSRCFYYL
uniref:Uncharacterized protein n=1 Tax=Spironucleus salmonicida TaxID=348837 RepID=V6LI08_9EUKA|eukprot:EST44167.1 Hypothetical protein SS50377_16023 [Spironucleus salmonicida]